MEIWVDIPHYEGLYEASNYGRIRTKQGKCTSSARCDVRIWKQRIMKQKVKTSKNGRKDAMICLWKDGKPRYYNVSRLICAAFHGDKLYTKMTVNHIDGNTMNNEAVNLEWLSLSDNIKYGFANGQFNSIMKCIVAVNDKGEEIGARSYAEMDRMLSRYRGYTSRTILIGGSCLQSADGTTYHII